MRLHPKLAAGLVGASALASSAAAQDAIQWRVEDGGNGHWYARIGSATTATLARASAVAVGGDLASISGASENQRVRTTAGGISHWIGGFQAPGSCEPGCGWSWSDGTPWTYTNWAYGEPNEGLGTPGESSIEFRNDGLWNDFWPWQLLPYVVEWSADCNADGVVDYGQIRDGELVDTNANNVPDCCEQGFDCRFNAVEWPVEDGGNGHWYQGMKFLSPIGWDESAKFASERGAYLATLRSPAEEHFVWNIAKSTVLWADRCGPWLGLFQLSGALEPAGGWLWVTGEPLDWANWLPGVPDNCIACCGGQAESAAHFFNPALSGPLRSWNDLPPNSACSGLYPMPIACLIEYSADCNADGVVDYGQIRAGELADANANNVPDCCEAGEPCGCVADLDGDGLVDAVDLTILLNRWGTDGGKAYPHADLDGSGEIDAADLAAVLFAWGPCP